ncbi:SDR family NAD(P)-dependent oxidoreductase, partial [Gordonia sp. NPDC003425]
MDYQNRTALITGASGGIGEEFAKALAARGAQLILVARSEDKLTALAETLHAEHGVRTEVVAADLSLPAAADEVIADVEARGLTVDILINNAGFGTHGFLAEDDPARIRDEVALNVGALTDFTTAYRLFEVERAIPFSSGIAGCWPAGRGCSGIVSGA